MAFVFTGRTAAQCESRIRRLEHAAWFDSLAPGEQSEPPLSPYHHRVRARAVAEDGAEGIRCAGLRPTHTPAVLITRGRINDQLGKIASLTPRDERRKTFRLLVAMLAIADGRRRERHCSNACGHGRHHLSATG